LIEGALRFSTGNAAKNSYLITTPTAALGVRGTIFTIEATRAKTLVTLNEGAMDVCMRAFRQRCVVLDHPGRQAILQSLNAQFWSASRKARLAQWPRQRAHCLDPGTPVSGRAC